MLQAAVLAAALLCQPVQLSALQEGMQLLYLKPASLNFTSRDPAGSALHQGHPAAWVASWCFGTSKPEIQVSGLVNQP
jgi:hypothetical protein